jgi:hypothetical protein
MVNVYGGEKHGYATLCMADAAEKGIKIGTVFYDIGCRFEATFKGWISTVTDPDVQAMCADTRILVPPMHIHAHK